VSDPAILEVLREILEAQRETNRLLLAFRPPVAHDEAEVALLREVFKVTNGFEFTCAELTLDVELSANSPDDRSLADVVQGCCRTISARALGDWMKSHEGKELGGLVISRASKRGANGV
jgi:hypothetical protein